MIQENKKLLLQDLCARLPYRGLICQTNKGKGTLISVECSFGEDLVYVDFGYPEAEEFDLNEDDEVKPYLRPLSSMTEEEKRHISKMMLLRTYDNGVVYDIPYDVYTPYYVMEDCLNYLRSIHIDYSGLIEKGLALEAPEGMYKKEE